MTHEVNVATLVFQNSETAVMFVLKTNPVGVALQYIFIDTGYVNEHALHHRFIVLFLLPRDQIRCFLSEYQYHLLT